MKKVICHQMKVVSEENLKHVHGAGHNHQGMSRSDALQTAISGDRGCVAGARDAQRDRH